MEIEYEQMLLNLSDLNNGRFTQKLEEMGQRRYELCSTTIIDTVDYFTSTNPQKNILLIFKRQMNFDEPTISEIVEWVNDEAGRSIIDEVGLRTFLKPK